MDEPEQKAKKRPRPTEEALKNLRRGSQPSERELEKEALMAAGPSVAELPATFLYDALRHVLVRPQSEDVTEIQKECREWLREDRKGFLVKYTELEKAHALRSAGAGAGQEDEDDDGYERAVELVKRLNGEKTNGP